MIEVGDWVLYKAYQFLFSGLRIAEVISVEQVESHYCTDEPGVEIRLKDYNDVLLPEDIIEVRSKQPVPPMIAGKERG